MSAHAADLGDTEESAPRNWQRGLSDASISAIVMIHAKNDGARRNLVVAVRQLAKNAGISEVAKLLEANALPGAKEHFGFRDGIGQPSIEGSPFTDKPGMGTPAPGNTWKPVKAGEFILGYEKESTAQEIPAEIRELCLNGTYLVFRKLQQNVGAFNQFIERASRIAYGSDAPGDQELIAAKLVGRWRNGNPLILSPIGNDPTPASDNDFRYNNDRNGKKCPLGAHIRRCNPRDALDGGDTDVRLHRLLRRGLPYGPHVDDSSDAEERGVAFFAMNANIERQFAFVQQNWVNNGEFAGLGNEERDPIVGANTSGRFTVPGASRFPFVPGLNRFVTTRGGGYFLEPGIAALNKLASK
ncbi:MAG: Dyp-type peroxidase [Alphaproteobacteria bacterium]|nr:Dyp-type peroxidase [Alphaproteobacteria bacterium]